MAQHAPNHCTDPRRRVSTSGGGWPPGKARGYPARCLETAPVQFRELLRIRSLSGVACKTRLCKRCSFDRRGFNASRAFPRAFQGPSVRTSRTVARFAATGDDALNMPPPNPSRRAVLFSLGAAAFKAFAKIGRIELGVCGNPDAFAQAEQWGFDYFEPGAASIAAMSESGIQRVSGTRPGVGSPLPEFQ